MKNETIYRRICNAGCGLGAHIEEHRIAYSHSEKSTQKSSPSVRLTEPMKRINGQLQAVSWETATKEIGDVLRKTRSTYGPEGIGIYIGEAAQRSARTLVRSLAFGVGSGTPNIFSEANLSFGPQLWATEKMVGHAASLMSDLSRAHYIVLLSGEQRDLGWGPFSPGEGHEEWIQHSRKTKSTKVVVADPRCTELADTMDKHVPIRPGSESYLMLGMLTAIVQRGWTDEQFIRDYTADFQELQTLIADWSIDDFAAECGIDAAELSGVALSFSRSAMAIVHPARQSFQNEAGALGAWAWLALHAVTANILRPGGLFENKGVIDLFPILTQLRTDKAPRTNTTQQPLLLMQAPASAMPNEVLGGSLRTLVSVSGDPVGRLPAPLQTQKAIDQLDLLVYIGSHDNQTAQLADWVLPEAPSWEQAALSLESTESNGSPKVGWSRPQTAVSHNTKPAEQILSNLYAILKPGLRGSVWGRHLGLLAQYIARTDVEQWEQKFLSEQLDDTPDRWKIIVDETEHWSAYMDADETTQNACYLHIGDGDRSLWRPSTPNSRIELLGPEIVHLIQNLTLRVPPPLVLRTGQWVEREMTLLGNPRQDHDLKVHLHPNLSFKEGCKVKISTSYGSCEATVVLDERLRDDVIDLPFYPGAPSLKLLSMDAIDPITGAISMDGLNATIEMD